MILWFKIKPHILSILALDPGAADHNMISQASTSPLESCACVSLYGIATLIDFIDKIWQYKALYYI